MTTYDDHTTADLCDDESLDSSRNVREACAILSAIELGYIESEDELENVYFGGMSTEGLAQVVISADSMKDIDDSAREVHAQRKADDVNNIVRILHKISEDAGSEYWNGVSIQELQHKAENGTGMSPQ